MEAGGGGGGGRGQGNPLRGPLVPTRLGLGYRGHPQMLIFPSVIASLLPASSWPLRGVELGRIHTYVWGFRKRVPPTCLSGPTPFQQLLHCGPHPCSFSGNGAPPSLVSLPSEGQVTAAVSDVGDQQPSCRLQPQHEEVAPPQELEGSLRTGTEGSGHRSAPARWLSETSYAHVPRAAVVNQFSSECHKIPQSRKPAQSSRRQRRSEQGEHGVGVPAGTARCTPGNLRADLTGMGRATPEM